MGLPGGLGGGYHHPKPAKAHIYGGMRNHFEVVWPVFVFGDPVVGLLLFPFALVDFPLSLAADTVILPYTIACEASDSKP